MTSAELHERLAAIGLEVNRASALLVSPTPDNLDRCARVLELASLLLMSLRSQLAAPDTATLAEAQRLESIIRRAASLLENAAAFHTAWRRILGAMCSGYRADGASQSVTPPARLCLEG